MKGIFKILAILGLLMITSCVKHEPNELALFKLNNLYFLKTEINNKKAFLLIDTGASITILDINQSEKYGFSVGNRIGNGMTTGINGSRSMYRISNYRISAQDNEFQMQVAGIDINEIVSKFKKLGIGVVGVLGSDFFHDTNANISYKKGTIELHPE